MCTKTCRREFVMSSRENPWRPKARRKGLLAEKAGDEVLAYNLERHRVHCLNNTAARIWGLCTGRRTIEQIAGELDIALDPASREAVVRDAISLLERHGLVESIDGATKRISRRELVRKIGIGALSAGVVLPMVTSIVAPTPVYAQSCIQNGFNCTSSSGCCSKCCNTKAKPPVCAQSSFC
jgi:hypothetical protein